MEPDINAAAQKPRLLFLCQTLPFPADGGVQIRTYNTLRQLSRVFEITVLSFYRRATTGSFDAVERGLQGLRRIAVAEAFPIPQEHAPARWVWDHTRSILLRRAYTRFAYESAAFRRRLRRLLSSDRFDLVHLDSLDLVAYLQDLSHIPVVCSHHNVESDLLRRRARTERSALRRKYFLIQAALTEREERTYAGVVALNTLVSEVDRSRLLEMVPHARTAVVPNGVDTKKFVPFGDVTDQQGLVFVGGYDWQPNRDAMVFFGNEILPFIRGSLPDVAVTGVGRAPLDADPYARLGLTLAGYVPDIRPIVGSAACYVVPLRVGGGTRLKILDAWAMGKAVVSTSIGCEGLRAIDGENILIRDEPRDFAEAVTAVLRDVDLRERLGRNARRLAEEVYDWDRIGSEMSAAYSHCLIHMRANAQDSRREDAQIAR